MKVHNNKSEHWFIVKVKAIVYTFSNSPVYKLIGKKREILNLVRNQRHMLDNKTDH